MIISIPLKTIDNQSTCLLCPCPCLYPCLSCLTKPYSMELTCLMIPATAIPSSSKPSGPKMASGMRSKGLKVYIANRIKYLSLESLRM